MIKIKKNIPDLELRSGEVFQDEDKMLNCIVNRLEKRGIEVDDAFELYEELSQEIEKEES